MRNVAIALDLEADLALVRQDPERPLEVIEEFGEHNGADFQLSAAGVEPADIEQLADEARQLLRL